MSSVFSPKSDSVLDQLGVKHNTDKSSVNRRRPDDIRQRGPGHNYLVKYELFLEKFKSSKQPTKLLELGAGPDWNIGASARVWHDYFPNLQLHIADIKPSSQGLASANTTIHLGDLGDDRFVASLAMHAPFDIIIDDASHLWSHQVKCLEHLFASLANGGIYIVEDILTSFGKMRERYNGGAVDDAFSILAHLSALVAGKSKPHPVIEASNLQPSILPSLAKLSRSIDMISFVNHSCIIVKAGD